MLLKTCFRIVSSLASMLCVLLLVVLLIPFIFFAWRVTRPMELPEFQGQSYIQFLAERQVAYNQLSHTYQESHPNVEVKPGICFGAELAVESSFSDTCYSHSDTSPYFQPVTFARITPAMCHFTTRSPRLPSHPGRVPTA